MNGQLHDPAALPPGVGGCVGLRAGLDVVEKRNISLPYRELNPNPSIDQPIT
jgi:hypothetical protein